jgi:hypothetical protein
LMTWLIRWNKSEGKNHYRNRRNWVWDNWREFSRSKKESGLRDWGKRWLE